MTLREFITKLEILEAKLTLTSMDAETAGNFQVRIGPVERKQYPHETHDIDDIEVKKDSLGTYYVELSEIPF